MAENPNHMRTPLKAVRHLGSAKEGASHFWLQRMTAVSNIVLVTFLIGLLATVAGGDYMAVKKTLSNPLVSLPLLLLVVSGVIHMRIGMQVIIEDYVSAEGAKVALLMLNTFFAIFVGLACVFAVMKLSFGA